MQNLAQLPSRKQYSIFLLLCCALIALIAISGVINGSFGHIGRDSDDGMRLVQIRDFLGGQNWFDSIQYRMGSVSGTEMHWSRLIDLPIIILIKFFDIFLPYAQAEALAISVWPPITSIFVMIGMFAGGRHLGGPKAAWFAAFVTAVFVVLNFRFQPGAIDHHNIQIGLLCISIGYALDPETRVKSFVICAFTLALSFMIGIEVYIFSAVICLFIAVLWAVKGAECQKAIIAFGLTLAITTLIGFFALIARQQYQTIQCDAFSFPAMIGLALGGAGLAINAAFLSQKSFQFRVAALILLGVISALILLRIAPECTSNPLSVLPADVKLLWLDQIKEARTIFTADDAWYFLVPKLIGGAIVSLIIVGLKIKNREKVLQFGLLAVLLLVAIFMTIYQIRFFPFAQFFAVFGFSVWIADLLLLKDSNGNRSVAYLGALGLALPFVWALPDVFFGPPIPDETNAPQDCYSDVAMDYLKTLPTGRISATENGGYRILSETDHSALTGNYHRNIHGISQTIKIFTGSADDAKAVLEKEKIDYLYFCSVTQESNVLRDHNPNGLMADLFKDNIPDYLTLLQSLQDQTVKIYAFTPNRTDRAE